MGKMNLTRRAFLGGAAAGGLALAGVASRRRHNRPKRPNVLFIPVDDLRVQLGCYGNTQIKSPNIDQLASQGVVFNRAYCQVAVCNPSRASMMTGLRPETVGVLDLKTHFRNTKPDAVTLPQYFMREGYRSQGLSKVYHDTLPDPQSWSAPWWNPPPIKAEYLGPCADSKLSWPWRAYDVPDSEFPDGQTARRAGELLEKLQARAFFLAVGFRRPHLPFIAPTRYFDMYKPEDIAPVANPAPPLNVPPVALHNWDELRARSGVPKEGPLSDQMARELTRAYYACVSYVDAQIGLVLRKLTELGLDENTIVVLWGDNGYQLGEHGLWCKHCNFEESTRVPLIVRAPGKMRGAISQALVESIDIYPTLCELAGLEVPRGVEGTSFVPLLENPARAWKKAAFSQFSRQVPDGPSVMGYSMRTDRYRYTEWKTKTNVYARELYDHQADPGENVNVVDAQGNEALVAGLSKQLNEGWKGALPIQGARPQ